ncbi:hypothetical protein F4604DRAFT_2042809 [Suillus subluteus]|nr:hypothetical protein F4604DRAFT_2042809 [Suillus subluteus]
MHKPMGHLLTQLEKPNERSFAFIAIGHTAADMKPFLDSIMTQIKFELQTQEVSSSTLLLITLAKTTRRGKSPELITFALFTLSTFDFSDHILNEFVRTAALPYLEDDNAGVRRAGCRLFVRDPICCQASSHAIEIVNDVQ